MKSEIVVKNLEKASKNFKFYNIYYKYCLIYKFAFLNELGLRLVDWIQMFKEIDQNIINDDGLDFSIDNVPANKSMHTVSLTPFTNLKYQPLLIRDFLSTTREEFEMFGNTVSMIIQEELECKEQISETNQQKIEKYSLIMSHWNEMLEIIVSRLLDSIKDKIQNSIGEDKEVSSEIEDTWLIYINVFKYFDNVINPRVLKISQLFEAKIRYPIELKFNPVGFSKANLIQKWKGFILEKSAIKAKLYYTDWCRLISDRKVNLIKSIISKSFEDILQELQEYAKSKLEYTDKAKNINMIETNPFSNVRNYMLQVLEVIWSFLIKAYDAWGTDIEGMFAPKLINSVISVIKDLITQYEYELNPAVMKQLYFEIVFLVDLHQSSSSKFN